MKTLFKSLVLVGSLGLLTIANAADLANGKYLSKSCALCHGTLGQGAPGQLSPRLAGLPEEYLVKAINDYKEGVRKNDLMMVTADIATMSEQDVTDVSAYYSRIDLSPDDHFNVKANAGGDADNGEELFNDDCDSCHAKDGYGKPRKEAPPLAGQHIEYLYSTIQVFNAKIRHHDNDPDDETFADYSDKEIIDILTHIASLDDAKLVDGGVAYVPQVEEKRRALKEGESEKGTLAISDITQTVVQMELKDGITREEAAISMQSKAAELNMKMVGEQKVSKELEDRGVDTPYLHIFQFCDPEQAKVMVVANPIYASYMPCRIAMVENQKTGKTLLMMLNLDMLIENDLLPQEVIEVAISVNQAMLDIMVAGATGDF